MASLNKQKISGYKEMEVPFILLSQAEHSKSLAIILPGAGYTTQAPLLHYSTEVFLNRSFDVLEINYQYNNEAYEDFTMEELSLAIQWDVKTVLDQVLENSSYENFYIVGKSLGTIAMVSEMDRKIFEDAKWVWLTPLIQRDDILEAMIRSKNGLSFIGDQDRCYTEERHNRLNHNPSITCQLIPGVGHSLEFEGDISKSLDILKDVITEIETF